MTNAGEGYYESQGYVGKPEYLLVDIETIAAPAEFLKPREPVFNENAPHPKTMKKEETIAAWREEQKVKFAEELEDWYNHTPLNAVTARVAIIGFKVVVPGGVGKYHIYHAGDPISNMNNRCANFTSESELIETGLAFLSRGVGRGAKIGGFNHTPFDIPLLMRRAWILGVPVPKNLKPKPRFWPDNFVDYLEVWKCGNYREKTGGMGTLAREMGIAEKTGDGGKFGDLWATDRAAAVAYNMADLDVLQEMHERMCA
jgi:hypothetical protein